MPLARGSSALPSVLFDMYLLCMIKARIRWCTCRVENILTLGKLLSLWFCFLLHSILFMISQTSYRTYKIISSSELARHVMGTIFLVTIEISLLASRSSLPDQSKPGNSFKLPRRKFGNGKEER